MKQNEKMDKWIEDTLNSLENADRATPKPYLITRINARIKSGSVGFWERAGLFVARPAVAFSGLALLIVVNVLVLLSSETNAYNSYVDQNASSQVDEFSNSVATIYDIENP